MVLLRAFPATRRLGEVVDLTLRWRPLLVFLVCAIPAVVTLTAQARGVFSDPRGSLLVAEQLIRNQTLALDGYSPAAVTGYQFYEMAGHVFYFFPLGTSIVSIPAVLALIALGASFPLDESGAQIIIAAVAASLTVYLSYRLARYFVTFATSVALALVFWLGTSLSSTGATALWSSNWAVVFALASLLVLVRLADGPCRWCWVGLGASLFMAYLSRPTMAILAFFVLGYAVIKVPRSGLLAGGLLAGLLGLLVAASQIALGASLPVYYRASRLATGTLAEAMAGNLWSPSRGVLVFTPLLLSIPILAVLTPANVKRHAGLLVVALGWPLVHLLAISLYPHWWAGYSYGPRLMTDALPGLFLAIAILWPSTWATLRAKVVLTMLAVLAFASIWIHSVQGLHNEWTAAWNREPSVDEYPATIWDWRYPQFLHDEQRHAERSLLPEYQWPS